MRGQPEGDNTPQPSICPVCGLTTTNGRVTHGEFASTVSHVCTEGHGHTVMWAVS